jgi:hypothetical protein
MRINLIIILFFLTLSVPVSFYYQNLYGQNQKSNVTSEFNANVTSNSKPRNGKFLNYRTRKINMQQLILMTQVYKKLMAYAYT